MNIQQNVSLKNFNTFGIDVTASKYVSVKSLAELIDVVSLEKNIFLLGGGSNLLITKNLEKLVVHLNLKGRSIEKENSDHAYIKVQAGENWHEFVLWCIENNYGGLENLSLIPGNVGTSPIQNIGAYGVEVKDIIETVETVEIDSAKVKTFNNTDCEFGYRDSIFKRSLKGKHIITSVVFKLTKKIHNINASYGAIQSQLNSKGITSPSIKDISNAVIAIRKSKLPDPKEIGNCGSFFKNPVISADAFKILQKKYPDIPFYTVSETETKIPAGWLIEQSGFKGKRFNQTGVHKKQALVIVNYGDATGKEIYDLAQTIQKTVFKKFDIPLEIEVNVV